MNFQRVALTMPRDSADELVLKGDENRFLVEVGIGLAVLGTEIPIGSLRGVLDHVAISYAETDEPDVVAVTLEPASADAAHPTFHLVRR